MQLQYVQVELDPKTKLSLNQVISNYSNTAKNRCAQFSNLASFERIITASAVLWLLHRKHF